MRIAIVTVQVPFIRGGAEILTEMLREELVKRGHQVDVVTIPFKASVCKIPTDADELCNNIVTRAPIIMPKNGFPPKI